MLVIIDYGLGNLGSLLNMMRKIEVKAIISSQVSEIKKATKLILPGVGAFDQGMKNLRKMGLIPVLTNKVLDGKTPILGICLGMQLFTQKSEEGYLKGLGWLKASTQRFQINQKSSLKIPHMGWNIITPCQKEPLFKNLSILNEKPRFYFVHSYHLVCQNQQEILAFTSYGYDFASVVKKDSLIGVQFHPEKSHKFGMKLLENFVNFY